MTKLEDGGAAFPRGPWERRDPDGKLLEADYGEFGMSLRDYFAAAALTGLMANDRTATSSSLVETDAPNIAQAAYVIADALLTHRRAPAKQG